MSDAQAPPPPPSNTPPPPSTPPPPQGTAPPPPGGSGGSSNDRTLMLVLSYLGPLALAPYFMEQEDKEIKWHSRNGLVLFAAEFLFWTLVSFVLGALTCVGLLLLPVVFLLGIANLGFHVYCIHKALKGERVVIPVLSDLTEQF